MKREAVQYLIKDILTSFTASTDRTLIGVFNRHLISKEIARSLFKDEIMAKKPSYHLLRGILMVQSNFIWQFPQSAFYEVLYVLDELKYCLQIDKRKTINKLSSQVIFQLFASLYFEFIMLPMHYKEDIKYINRFKDYFAKEEILEIMENDMFLTRFTFQQHGVELGIQVEVETRLNKILNEFYKSAS